MDDGGLNGVKLSIRLQVRIADLFFSSDNLYGSRKYHVTPAGLWVDTYQAETYQFVSALGSPILALTGTADGQTQSVIVKELETERGEEVLRQPKPARSAYISSEMQARRNV